ncbi:hypothetical protein D3C81_2315680 [compost metagenome]
MLGGIEQGVPKLGSRCGLAHIQRIFITRLIAGLIAETTPDVRYGMFLLWDTRDHLLIQSFTQRLLRL